MTADTASASAAPTRLSPWMRYRRQYARLSPPVQMIGLQLWLPLLFVIVFCLCYVNAFHQPTPKNVPVAVVGTGPAVTTLADTLESASHGSLSVSVVASPEAARGDVRSGDLAGAFVPGGAGRPAHLTIASGDQFQLATLARSTFAPLAAAQGTTLAVDDIAPLPKHDSFGTTVFYVTLVFIIPAYMVGMFVGMMGAGLGHRVRLGIIAGTSLVFSLIGAVLCGPVLGAVHGHLPAVWLLGFATACTVGLAVNGLAYFLGRFVTGAALIVFVFVNIPAAGGAYPPSFMPEPFKALHPYVIGTGVLDVLRDVIYGVGPGLGRGALIIGCYAAAGALLTAVGRPYFLRRTRLRAERGAPVSMMLAAQGAAMAARHAEEAHAEQGSAGRSPAEKERAEKERAEKERAEKERVRPTEQEIADNEIPENEFADDEAESDAAAVSGAAAGGSA